MLDLSGSWQGAVASWALTYLVHSTVLIGLAWGITRLAWVRAPRAREIIWTVALLGGLGTSLARTMDRPRVVDRQVDVELRMVQGALPAPLPPSGTHFESLHWEGHRPVPGALTATLGEACPEALNAPGRGGQAWLDGVQAECVPPQKGGTGRLPWLFLLWLLGAASLGWRELRSHLALRRIRLALQPAGDRVRCTLARVVDGLELGAVRAGVSAQVDAPCVVDSRTVVLPPRCQDELDDSELLAVLAHEVAHLGRRDVRWQSLFRWLAVALWFQPLNRLALKRLRDVVELVCDDWAVARIPRPLDLARSLSRVAEWSSPTSRRQPVLAGSQGGRLCERVRRILAPTKDGHAGGRIRGAMVAAALVAALTQLPSVQLPGATERGLLVFREGTALDAAADTVAEVRQIRVRVREIDS